MPEIIGLQLHLIVLPAVFLALGVIAILLGLIQVWVDRVTYSDGIGWAGASISIAILAVIPGAIWAVSAFPYDSHYWSLYRVSGEVTSVSNGLSSGDGDVTYRSYVLTVADDPTPYVLDNPRAVNLEGKRVDLTCTVGWAYLAADQWSCEIAGVQS